MKEEKWESRSSASYDLLTSHHPFQAVGLSHEFTVLQRKWGNGFVVSQHFLKHFPSLLRYLCICCYLLLNMWACFQPFPWSFNLLFLAPGHVVWQRWSLTTPPFSPRQDLSVSQHVTSASRTSAPFGSSYEFEIHPLSLEHMCGLAWYSPPTTKSSLVQLGFLNLITSALIRIQSLVTIPHLLSCAFSSDESMMLLANWGF